MCHVVDLLLHLNDVSTHLYSSPLSNLPSIYDMKNDEDFSEFFFDDNSDDLGEDLLSLKTAKNLSGSKITIAGKANEGQSPEQVDVEEITAAVETTMKPTASESNIELSSILESKKEKSESISQLESNYYELQAKWEMAQVQRVRDQAEIDRLNSQIESQTAFSLNLGAVMGHLVWRASYEPEVIGSWFTKQSYQTKVEEFVSIADRIIGTFFKMYEQVLPPYSTDEYQFVRGLLGTVANMAVIPEGRRFLIDNKDGKSLLRSLVFFLSRIPMPSGVPLKRSVIVILWNMSVNKSVLSYLFDLQIGQVVAHCLDENNPEILQILGFELLLSITYNLTDRRLLDEVLKYVPIEWIHRIAENDEGKIGELAQAFMNYLASNENIASAPNINNRE